jgi:type VI secretion system protein VasD
MNMTGRKQFFILLALVQAMLVACGGQTPPPPPKPTNVILEIEASPDVNPNPGGRPSPLALRIYELKSLSGFNSADFVSLYRKDEGVLGAELVRKHELIVQPNERKTLRIEVSSDTRAIGAFAVFRNYEQAQWRGTAGIRPHETTVVQVKAGANNLTLEHSLQKPLDAK